LRYAYYSRENDDASSWHQAQREIESDG
jgi:hypothetical protein